MKVLKTGTRNDSLGITRITENSGAVIFKIDSVVEHTLSRAKKKKGEPTFVFLTMNVVVFATR